MYVIYLDPADPCPFPAPDHTIPQHRKCVRKSRACSFRLTRCEDREDPRGWTRSGLPLRSPRDLRGGVGAPLGDLRGGVAEDPGVPADLRT